MRHQQLVKMNNRSLSTRWISNAARVVVSSLALIALGCSDDEPGTGWVDAGAGGSGGSAGSGSVEAGGGVDARPDNSFDDRGPDEGDAVATDTRSEPRLDGLAVDVAADVGDGGYNPTTPRFSRIGKYMIDIPVGDAGPPDPAEIYYPEPPDLRTGRYSFPIILLFQGAKVARGFYSTVLATVASHGFVVVAPDHVSNNLGGPGLYAELSEIGYVLSQMKLENASTTSPVRGVVDTGRLALIGHSYGGASGLSGMANLCFPPIPFCSFTRPPELVGGAFFGTNIGAPLGPVHTGGLPVLLVQGEKDGKATPASGKQTYDALSRPPKAYITLLGANHYGMTDVDNPSGADPEVSVQTLDHATGVMSVGRWMGVFFAAYLAKDPTKLDAFRNAAKLDPNVTITFTE